MKYALVYGSLSGLVVIVVLISGLTFGGHLFGSYFFGYLVMLVALSFIFVGVRRYRDVECGGVIRFGRAFAVGLGIAVVAGLVYALVWDIYLAATGYRFMEEYSASMIEGMRTQGATAAAIEAKVAEMREFTVMYRNPLFRLPMTFIEIFPVGLLIALLSAGLLRNPKLLPAKVGTARAEPARP